MDKPIDNHAALASQAEYFRQKHRKAVESYGRTVLDLSAAVERLQRERDAAVALAERCRRDA